MATKITKINTKAIMMETNRYISNCADKVVRNAKEIAPVRTGALKLSIHKEQIEPLQYAVIADTDYALYIELGTSKMGAQPYLRPALRNKENYRK